MSERTGPTRLALPETAIGLGLLAFAALALWQTWQIPASPMYAQVGPTAFPYVTVAGLALLAILLLVQAARGGWQPDDEKNVPLDWRVQWFPPHDTTVMLH